MVGIFNDHVLSVTYCLERLKASGVSEQRGPRVDAWIRFFKDLDAFRGALSTNRGLFDRCPLRIRCEALRQHWRCPRALQHCCQLKLHLETFSEFLEGSSDAYLVGNDLTLADLYGVCGLAPVMALLPFDFPKVEDWLKRCLDHELFSEQHEIRDWLDDKPILWFQEDLEDFEARLEKKAAWIRKPRLPRGIYDEEKELIEAPPPPPSAPLPPSQPAPLPPSPRQKAPPQKAAPRCSWYDQIPGWGTFLQKLGQASLSFAGAEYGLVFVAEQRWKRRTWRSVYAGPPRDLEDPVLADGFSPWSSESVALHAWRPLTVAESTTFQYWDLEILQVADDFIGLKKPPGLSYQGEIANFGKLLQQKLVAVGADSQQGRLCHRLETQCSGVQIYAQTSDALEKFLQHRRQGQVLMEAIALVEGCVGVDEPSEGAVEVPLLPWQDAQGRDLGSVACAKDGLAACTSYKVLKRFHVPNAGPVSFWPRSRWFSLVQIACHSDRICQVYAHMAFIGHPVVCEPKYNAMNFEDDSALLPRTFLHVLRVELPLFSCSCDLAPDLQVALLRLQSLALDTKVCQTWTSRLPGLPLLLSCRGSLPPDPEGPDQKFRSETSKQTGRCSCCGDLEEAQCCPVGMAALHWTLRPAKSQTEEVSWDSEPCRLWAFGVRGWIPFELRSNRWDDWSSRAPAPGGLSGETLPTWWKRHGIRWCWAHDGSRVNGWIELNDKGSLMSKWGTGFWQTVNGDEQGHFLVVGINNMSHLLYLKEEVFEVLVKRPSNAAEDWKVLYDVEPCCATRGWPARSGQA